MRSTNQSAFEWWLCRCDLPGRLGAGLSLRANGRAIPHRESLDIAGRLSAVVHHVLPAICATAMARAVARADDSRCHPRARHRHARHHRVQRGHDRQNHDRAYHYRNRHPWSASVASPFCRCHIDRPVLCRRCVPSRLGDGQSPHGVRKVTRSLRHRRRSNHSRRHNRRRRRRCRPNRAK